MIRLEELAGSLERGTVTVRGREVEVRALSAADTDAIRQALPPPAPPMIKDPQRGSAAPRVPDHDDPGYRLALRSYGQLYQAAEAALAMGLEVEGKRPGDEGYLPAAAHAVMAALSEFELERIVRRVYELGGLAADPPGPATS